MVGFERIPSYLEKLDMVYKEKEVELQKLGLELDGLYMKRDLIKKDAELENLIKLLEGKYKELSKEYHSVLISRFLDFDDSVNAIAYLISLIEEKHYKVGEYRTKLYYPPYSSKRKSDYYDYRICYLVSDDKQDLAREELDRRFLIDSDNLDRCYERVNELNIPSDNYIQIAYYKGDFAKKIDYTYKNFAKVKGEQDTFIISQLCDWRYSYILDYIDSVIEYKLGKKDLIVTREEMIMLADTFAQQFKFQKSINK